MLCNLEGRPAQLCRFTILLYSTDACGICALYILLLQDAQLLWSVLLQASFKFLVSCTVQSHVGFVHGTSHCCKLLNCPGLCCCKPSCTIAVRLCTSAYYNGQFMMVKNASHLGTVPKAAHLSAVLKLGAPSFAGTSSTGSTCVQAGDSGAGR